MFLGSWTREVSVTVVAENTKARSKGSITRDNDRYGRYRGEVQITLRDLPADERVNVVGRVVEADLPLLSFLQPGQIVKLIQVLIPGLVKRVA